MNFFKKAALWFWMLTKRLYKKPIFALILISLPLTTLLYREVTKEGGGAVTVALAQEGSDPLSQQLIEKLPGSSQLVQWRICDTPEDGMTLLRSGKADALWVFPDQMKEKIISFVKYPDTNGSFIKVYQRQENVLLSLCRERLSGLVFPETAKQVYLNYLREEWPELAEKTDQELLPYYENIAFSDGLFAFSSDGAGGAAASLLLSPLKGLLSMLVQLCALAAAMYYLEDRKSGTFAWVKVSQQWIPELACQLVCVLQVAMVTWLCLLLSGLSQPTFRDWGQMMLYALCCSGFSMVLRRIFPRVHLLAVLIPLLCVGMLVLCPVFFDFTTLSAVQQFFPLNWYLRSDLSGLGIYGLICFSFVALSELRKQH